MAVNIPGLFMIVVFYAFVLGTGIWAWKKSQKLGSSSSGRLENLFLANRSVGFLVGVFTMTATWVGGGFVVGVAEFVSDPARGLLWALVPLQCSVSFTIGGLFFAKPMREKNYISMMDPFHRKYGKPLTAVLAIVPVITEIVWIPTLLIPLGATLSVVLELSFSICIWISSVVAIIYTVLGGLYSVACTDVIQMSLVLIAMWLCVPFVLMSDSYTDITQTAFNNTHQAPWLGHIQTKDIWRWIDQFLVLSIGNLATQDFHQRTLSSSSMSTARLICFIAAGFVLLAAIPSTLIGAVAASTDWNSTSYGSPSPHERGEGAMVLPIILHCLTPSFIFAIGIGAVAAAAMSSADSLLLSASTVFTTNIYQTIRIQASDKELKWVIRLSTVVVGLMGTCFSYLNGNIMMFWILGSDLSYSTILPQLICVLFTDVSNGYGATAGFLVSVTMRVLCGEPIFGLPAILQFPGYSLEDGHYIQRAPVKTICMLISLVSILVFSILTSFLFNKGFLPERWDVFHVKPTPAQDLPDGDINEATDKSSSKPLLHMVSSDDC